MVNKEKQRLFRKPDDVLAAAENYIEEHGTKRSKGSLESQVMFAATKNYIEEHGTEAFEMLIATSKV